MSAVRTDEALQELVAAVRGRYREKLVSVRPIERAAKLELDDSADLELVVVLVDGGGSIATERRAIEELAFGISSAHDLYIRPWVVAQTHWESPQHSDHPSLIAELKRHASAFAFAS